MFSVLFCFSILVPGGFCLLFYLGFFFIVFEISHGVVHDDLELRSSCPSLGGRGADTCYLLVFVFIWELVSHCDKHFLLLFSLFILHNFVVILQILDSLIYFSFFSLSMLIS